MHGWQAILCARVRCQFYEGFARNIKATGYAGGSLLWTSVSDAEGGTKKPPAMRVETKSYTKKITVPVR